MGSSASLRAALGGHRYALLTTFRRNGQPVATPVWFALADDKVYFRTSPRTGKAKRLRYGARVQIAPSTVGGRPLGPVVEATARRVRPTVRGAAAQESCVMATGRVCRCGEIFLTLRRSQRLGRMP